jgi:iron complex outermembrane recepter protein
MKPWNTTNVIIVVFGLICVVKNITNIARAQQAGPSAEIPQITVPAPAAQSGYATNPQFHTNNADLGPLGSQPILDTPASITTVPEDLLVNQQASTVNQALSYLPSVVLNDQEGYEVSRPQSRGFEGGIAQNTRLDGLNVIGTTAIPTENLSGVQVLNGLAGSLYGPETAAGVFDYILKRPTDTPLYRFIEGFDSSGVFTEQADIGGRTGPNDAIGYRLNFVHGQGESYVPDSNVNRTLFSADLDWHLDDQTVVQTDFSHYSTDITGLAGSIVYDSNKNTILPPAVNPTKLGYGQPGAGSDLITDTGLVKIIHNFNDNWSMEVGGLYQNAIRNLLGISDTMLDNNGNYTATKNFDSVSRFTIGSNLAYLHGHFDILGMRNDLTVGTNGFVNGQYSYRNSITTTLGTANLANPVVFPVQPTLPNGGEYESGSIREQSIIFGDTLHFNQHWAVQGVLSTSFLNDRSYTPSGQVTSADSRNGVISPTVSLIYTPIPKLMAYATYAEGVEEGDEAPPGTANVHQFMAPYTDREYEAGVKCRQRFISGHP